MNWIMFGMYKAQKETFLVANQLSNSNCKNAPWDQHCSLCLWRDINGILLSSDVLQLWLSI